MTHAFDTSLAEKYGIEYSLIVGYISFMCDHNRRNNRNIHDEKAYTYNTYDALHEHFSYISRRKIETVIKQAEKNGHIESRNDLNDNKWDKTKWYHRTHKDILVDGAKNETSTTQKKSIHNKVQNKHIPNTEHKKINKKEKQFRDLLESLAEKIKAKSKVQFTKKAFTLYKDSKYSDNELKEMYLSHATHSKEFTKTFSNFLLNIEEVIDILGNVKKDTFDLSGKDYNTDGEF